ncbi:MAG: serine hydrolase [Chitinophagaceae bacterium]|jgi:CubicO group peptidase (beta-lactamase class C family)|nr:serine hydrolase [Chitinophagaceae bacterium]
MRLLLILSLFLITSFSFTQSRFDSITTQLDAHILKAIADWKVPGISVAVTVRDSIVYSKAFGFADVVQNKQVTTNTIFPIGSMGKSFTAFSLTLLQEKGVLSLNDKVIQWLPWFTMTDKHLQNNLTIADLLSHRTGMETFTGDLLWTESNLSNREVINKWGEIKPQFPIRSRFGYSNIAYMVAGEIIQSATGTNWKQFVNRQLLQPLKMQRSFLYEDEALQQSDVAKGYTMVGDIVTEIPKGTGVSEAFGGMYSTANDIAKWLMMHANDGSVCGQQIFATGPVWEVRNPFSIVGKNYFANGKRFFVNYGLGWELLNYNNTDLVSHGGAYSGYLSMMGFIPEQKAGFVILTNSDSHELTEALRWTIIDVLSGSSVKDYSTDVLNYVGYQQIEMKKSEQQLADSASLQIPLPLPVQQFTGVYHNNIYGDIFLTNEGNELRLRMQHHPSITARLHFIGNNRFYCIYNHPMFGKTVWAFEIKNRKVHGLILSVNSMLEYTTYAFVKIS